MTHLRVSLVGFMHLVLLFEFPTLLGGERSLLALLAEWQRRACEWRITALAPPTGPLAAALRDLSLTHLPWSVRDEQGNRRPDQDVEQELIAVLSRLQPDLAHANSLAMGRLLGRIQPRVSGVTTAHLRDIIRLSRAAVADLNRHARLIAVSQAAAEFHARQGVDRERLTVVYNGVDLDQFRPRPATGYLHRELGLPRDARLIAAIGQIGLRKGWDVLAEALSRLKERESLHLLLIGARYSTKEESRELERQLKTAFHSAGWDQRVHWLGERSDVSMILPELELLVHPSRQEPLGRVLLEALASGTPILATDVGGTGEIIEPGISGCLVPPGDAPGLATALQSVLADSSLRREFATAGRQRAEALFDLPRAAEHLKSVWHSVVR